MIYTMMLPDVIFSLQIKLLATWHVHQFSKIKGNPNSYIVYGIWLMRKNCNQEHCILVSKDKVQSSSNNRLCQLFTYQISLTNSYCSNQKLTSCIILVISNFLARFVQKISMTKIKLFSVTSVNFGFILNVTTRIIQITGIFKTVMNPGIALNVAAQFFLSIPY